MTDSQWTMGLYVLGIAKKIGASLPQCGKGQSILITSPPATFRPCDVCREIPQELMKAARGGEVDVDIKDKRDEAYVKPKPKVVAFSGEGRKLGRLVG